MHEAYEPMLQAAQSNRSMPLRISAVGALGALGNPKAVPFLTQLASGKETRLTLPATRALEQINARAGSGG
jgi:HEAT repeat protein